MDAPLSELIVKGRTKLPGRRNGFMFCGILRFIFFYFWSAKSKNEIYAALIRARPMNHSSSNNPTVSLGVVDSWLFTRRHALKDDY